MIRLVSSTDHTGGDRALIDDYFQTCSVVDEHLQQCNLCKLAAGHNPWGAFEHSGGPDEVLQGASLEAVKHT